MANDLPQVGAEAIFVHDQYDKGIDAAIKKADKLDARVDDLGGDVDVKVNVNDADVKTAKGMVDDLDTTVSTKVNVDDAEVTDVSDQLDDIATIGAIDLAINIAGGAKEFFDSLGRFSGVGGVLELDNALASIEGRTGRMIPDAEKLITDLYTNGWGESRAAIADTIVEASNLKIANEDLAQATLTAFQVQSVMGGDTNEILRTMDSLVKNDLAPDFEAAGNLIVTGLQNGADRGQDLLDTFNEYGTTFGQLRISGPGALALINSGLDAGIDNSDRIADAIRETGIRLAEMGTDPNIKAAFTQLDALSDVDLAGLLNAYEEGKISGDEFFNGFFEAFSDAEEVDPQKASNLATTLIGTQSEDFKIGAISQLTTTWDDTMGTLEDRAETAGNTISDNLGTSIDTLLRTIEQGAVDFLSSEQIDLPEKIDAIKKGIQDALGVLASGGTVGEAIEVAFGIEGVDTALSNIQRIFGQFVIALLEIVATIQDPLGINDNDKGTRAEIARMATQQLPFDIKLANPEELDAIFGQAAKRGVTNLGGALITALDELVAEGNFDQAQSIIGKILSSPDVSPEAAQILATKYEQMIAEAQAAMKPPPQTEGWWNNLKPPSDALEMTLGKGTSGGSSRGDGWWTSLTPPPEAADAVKAWWDNLKPPEDSGGGLLGSITGDVDDAITKITDLDTTTATATENTATNWDNLNISLTEDAAAIVETIEGAAAKVEEMDMRVASALTENTVTASFDAVLARAAADFPAVDRFLDSTSGRVQQLDIYSKAATISLGGLAAGVKVFPVAKLEQIVTLATAFAGAQNIVNNDNSTKIVNVTNNNSNGAQTSNSDYDLSQNLGGG